MKKQLAPAGIDLKTYESVAKFSQSLEGEDVSQTTNIKDLGINENKIVSFGKLFAVFMANALISVDSIDEAQVYFYSLNDSAGAAAGLNIAEFPIETALFLDQYKQHVEHRRTERITVEEFVKLAVDAQLHSQRAIPYGFKKFMKPYSNPSEINTLKDNLDKTARAEYEGKMIGFKMPQIDIYIETNYGINKDGNSILRAFNGFKGTDSTKKITKIHIFDKTVDPYKAAGLILRGDDANTFYEFTDSSVFKATDMQTLLQMKSLNAAQLAALGDNKTQLTVSRLTDNEKVKHAVSKLVPSIIYGMNSSAVFDATLSTKHDSALASAQLLGLNSGKQVNAAPDGSGTGGLPLKVIPASLTMKTIGCPLLTYGQLFFVDFNTGTTVDNIYGITNLTHTFTPGKYECSFQMAFYDAYGKYEGAQTWIDYIVDTAKKMGNEKK